MRTDLTQRDDAKDIVLARFEHLLVPQPRAFWIAKKGRKERWAAHAYVFDVFHVFVRLHMRLYASFESSCLNVLVIASIDAPKSTRNSHRTIACTTVGFCTTIARRMQLWQGESWMATQTRLSHLSASRLMSQLTT